MAGREPITIKLGEKDFAIRPLTMRQLQSLEATLFAMPGTAEAGSSQVKDSCSIIEIALSRDHASVDMNDVEASMPEVVAAMRAVLQLGGFMPGAPGESAAAAQSA